MQENDFPLVQEEDLPLAQEEDLLFVPRYGARYGIKYATILGIIFRQYLVPYLVPCLIPYLDIFGTLLLIISEASRPTIGGVWGVEKNETTPFGTTPFYIFS